MAETKIHSFRIPDQVWERAQLVAEHHNTTVTAMVVDFLRKVNYRAYPKITASTQATKQVGPSIQVGKHPAKPGSRADRVRELSKDKTRYMDRAVCPHDVVKTIPYGTFCTGCGKRMDKDEA